MTSITSKAPLAAIAQSLQRERAKAGLSQSELAKRAGIAKSTLSQLESGTGNPSIETLWALGVALSVPFGQLVEPSRPAVTVIRSGEGDGIASDRADYVATLLAAGTPSTRSDIYRVNASPGAARTSAPHQAGVIEHVVIVTGRALVGPAAEPVTLEAGDYLSYPGDVEHVFEALEPDTVAVTVSEHR